MKKVLAVIPARYGSTRLHAKPLVLIAGKPLLQWVIEGVKKCTRLDEIKVATDHPEIFQLAQSCGVTPVMTAPELPSGTDRVFAAAISSSAEIILNIQGDEPLVHPGVIDALIEPFETQPELEMSTVSQPLDRAELGEESIVKALLNAKREAIYFSRFPIPYSRNQPSSDLLVCEKHLGFYGFRRDFLTRFCQTAPTEIEQGESLEQLRALHMGAKIAVRRVEGAFVSIDLAEHIPIAERLLSERI